MRSNELPDARRRHESLSVGTGPRAGLPIAIAVHSTVAGPAIGGCRVKPYASWRAGVDDALALSQAMTVKCRVAGLPHGGGKAVAFAPPGTLPPARRRALISDIADAVAALGGRYRTGPDIGTNASDMGVIHERTGGWAFGRPESDGGSGESSAATARGVLAALAAGLTFAGMSRDVDGLTVGIIGYGSVGSRIATALTRAGATVTAFDTDPARRVVARSVGVRWSATTPARDDYDVLVPAATAGLLTRGFADQCRARLIVGPANNQLRDADALPALEKRGIVWIPDVVASAGGVVGAVCRETFGLSVEETDRRVDGLGATAMRVLCEAQARRTSVLQVIDDLTFRPILATAS